MVEHTPHLFAVRKHCPRKRCDRFHLTNENSPQHPDAHVPLLAQSSTQHAADGFGPELSLQQSQAQSASRIVRRVASQKLMGRNQMIWKVGWVHVSVSTTRRVVRGAAYEHVRIEQDPWGGKGGSGIWSLTRYDDSFCQDQAHEARDGLRLKWQLQRSVPLVSLNNRKRKQGAVGGHDRDRVASTKGLDFIMETLLLGWPGRLWASGDWRAERTGCIRAGSV